MSISDTSTDHDTILIMLRWSLAIILLLILSANLARATFAEEEDLLPVSVQPGDTWTALSIRYGLSTSELMAYTGTINPQRQPVIGSTLLLPKVDEKHGRLLRPLAGGLLETAAQKGRSPWAIALQNDLPNPYTPLLYTPVFLDGGSTPPREMPFGFETLDLSLIPAHPGQALALRARTESEQEAMISLEGEIWNVNRNGDRLLALGATGAFFGAGQPELRIHSGKNPPWTQPWLFEDKEWTFDQVSFAATAATDQEAMRLERERLRDIWAIVTPDVLWSTSFQWPLQEYVARTSLYGARRSVNGGPYATYHEGTDFSAYRGSPVYAPATGSVVLAESLTVRGGAVILDHGLGIHTGFYHLSEIEVKSGQKVDGGDLIGKVGSTGRSTGNHLHWDLLIGTVWVDAEAWMEQNLADWIRNAWGIPFPSLERSNIPSTR
jgi:murein DD-endopeptidase MepM/ murein hydrolase activator NlpD